MMLPMFVVLGVTVFITQLIFCLYAKREWVKWLPVGITGALCVICWLLYFLGAVSHRYGAELAVWIYGIVLLMVTAIACFAWVIYSIVKVVQKRRK